VKFRLRDILLLLVGLAGGYIAAVTTRAGSVPFLQPARAYVSTHQVESCVGLVLVGVIVYLAGGKGGRR
jgi:hypothetical protein